jgi:DNA-binding CsgD family transcriptional regulator
MHQLACRAFLLAEQGNTGEAATCLAEAKRTYTPHEMSLVALTELAEASIAQQPAPITEWSVFPETLVMSLRLMVAGPTDIDLRALGPLLSAHADRLDGVPTAADQFDAMGVPLLAAQARLENAERTKDKDAIGPCLAVFEQAGMAPWVDRTRRLARTLGVRIAATRTAGPLTKRESEVVRLLGQGFSNAEIATRLFLSERTVETHLRNSYAKFGLTSRVALTTWAMQEL